MKVLRVTGDTHGKYDEYLDLIKNVDYSLQLGDFGFSYDCLEGIDPGRNKIIWGNHCNYDKFDEVPHNLGNFGTWSVGDLDIFYVRGGFSLDWMHRLPGVSWWESEQLNYVERKECLELYKEIKPSFVVSHEPTFSILQYLAKPGVAQHFGYADHLIKTHTNQLLEEMLGFHRPKTWISGHMHTSWKKTIGGTKFISLAELEYKDYFIMEK